MWGARIYESAQDIWQGHLHTRPADLHHPKDHARDVGIVTVWKDIDLPKIYFRICMGRRVVELWKTSFELLPYLKAL